MWRRLLLPLVLLPAAATAAAGLSGCSAGVHHGPQVVASFYPLQYVAERIVGPHAAVTDLTAPGVEPHDIELSPRQVAKISGATVMFYEKGLQPAVDDAVAEQRSRPRGRCRQCGRPAPRGRPGGPALLAGPHPARAGGGRVHGVDEQGSDPRTPPTSRRATRPCRRTCEQLDREFRAGLRSCRTRTVVVSHDAFNYLGARYHLDFRPITGISPDAEPSARHLAELADLIRSDGITTVFNERLASPKLADTLARDLGRAHGRARPDRGLELGGRAR